MLRFPFTSASSSSRRVNLDTNWLPRSKMMLSGSPLLLKTFFRYKFSVSSAVMFEVVAMKCAIFVSRSIHTYIASYLWEDGSCTPKSMDTDCQGPFEMGRGWSWPWWWRHGVLFLAQVSQVLTYSLTNSLISGARATLPATQPVGQRSNSNPNWSAFEFQPRLSDSIRARV